MKKIFILLAVVSFFACRKPEKPAEATTEPEVEQVDSIGQVDSIK